MAKQFEGDKPTFEEIRALRKPRTESVWVPLDAEVIDRMAELERAIKVEGNIDARENRASVAPRLQTELDELQAHAEEIAVEFRFRELPRKKYREIIDAHPDPEGKLRWDEDTFAPALIAACALEPEITPEQARELWDEWGASVAYLLFGVAVNLCEGPTKVPTGARSSAETDGSERSSTTAPPEESDTPSS